MANAGKDAEKNVEKKILILVRGKTLPEKSGDVYGDFTAGILNAAKAAATRPAVGSCKLTVTSVPPPGGSVIPYKKGPVALITLTGSGASDRPEDGGGISGGELREIIDEIGGAAGCYEGNCVFPAAYEKTWRDGDATPGAGLLTLLRRKPGLDDKEFFRRWYEGHTPLSLRIHPLWNYARNAVAGKIVPESEHWEGIVEEHFREAEDLTKAVRFFDGPWKTIGNMFRVLKDSKGFIDMKTIEPYFVTEYWLKSPEPASEEIPAGSR